jgi:H+/Cl- antiporter ClcA
LQRQFYSPQPNVPGQGIVAGYGWTFWALVAAIGALAGLAGAALTLLLRALMHLFWGYHGIHLLPAVQHAAHLHRVLVLAGAGVLAGVGALFLRRLRGMGGSEVSEALWLGDAKLNVFASVSRALLSITIIAGGASLGREAAPQLAGGAFASKLSEWAKLPAPQRRLLVACGASAGMAAVYNVPLGAALFALEVLLGTLSLPLVLPALGTSVIATAVAWIALPNAALYRLPAGRLSASLVVFAVLAAPLAGLASVAWVRLVRLAHRVKPEAGWRRLVRPIVVLTGLGVLAIPYPQLLGNGRGVVQLTLVGQVAVGLAAVLFVLKPLVTAGCLGSGAPGGLFTPTLMYGVLGGTLLGHLWALIWPGPASGEFALIGGGAVLAASMQGPLSAIALILEMVDNSSALIVPLVIAITGATVLARRLGAPSIYSARLGEPAEAADETGAPQAVIA